MTEETERKDGSPGHREARDGRAAAGADEETGAGGGPAGAGDGGEAGEAGDVAGQWAGEVEALRDELQALNDRHLRLAAEFDNYRKRNERDRQALVTRQQSDLLLALLDVLDDLQRVAASDSDAPALVEGIRLVEKKFLGVLEGAGVEPVDAEGAPFDPELMEALMTVPTDDPDEDHRVADVFQRGYRFRDTLLRPARVRVLQYEEPSDQGD